MTRLEPAGPAEAYTTFRIRRPTGARLMWDRDVPCARAGCEHYEHGWQTQVDEGTELGRRQAHYIRRESGRSFLEHRDGALTVFRFSAGQECFAGKHDVPTQAEPLYIVTGGDWRGNPHAVAPRRHTNAAHWVEEFAENQDAVADRIRKG